MTAEQLEAARAERMRQNGHGAINIEDVRTWIEETGLCVFLPRSAQASQPLSPAPSFIEAVAGQRTTEPTLELIASAESLLVRLEAEGVAVRLNLSGQPAGHSGGAPHITDQPDYVVAGWVLPYIYALRGDRDWRRSPQLTGSRQVSQLAVLAAKQIDGANMTATEIRDALGREVTEAAVLRALHELWRQLRIIPVVPAVGAPALWQPLRQRFQKAIAEGASTSQVTAISVLASIYLQAVIAGSMEDVEMFLSPLTSRSKIREVVRGLAATRQVHSTTMGTSPMFYVAGTLPEFPAVPSFQIGASPSYRNSNYRGSGYGSAYLASYLGHAQEDDHFDSTPDVIADKATVHSSYEAIEISPVAAHATNPPRPEVQIRRKPAATSVGHTPTQATANAGGKTRSAKAAPPRPRTAHTANGAGDRRRAPAPRSTASSGNGSRSASASRSNGHSASNGNGNGTAKSNANRASSSPARNGSYSNGNGSHTAAHSSKATAAPRSSAKAAKPAEREPSAAKRYSFSGQAKQAPKSASSKPVPRAASSNSRADKPKAGSARSTGSKLRG